MNAVVIPLRRVGVFVPAKKGSPKFCEECGVARHAHPRVPCSSCGESYRACPFRANATGFSACDEHRSGVRR